MTLSQRDKVIVVLLPMLVVGFVYYWYWRQPESAKLRKLRGQLAEYSMDSSAMENLVRNADKELEEFKQTREQRLRELEARRREIAGQRQWTGETPPEQRFQCFTRQLNAAGMRLVSAKREESAGKLNVTLAEAFRRLSRWKVQLQGTYRQLQDFLSENRESGWCVPVCVEMSPASEMGKPAHWTLEIMI